MEPANEPDGDGMGMNDFLRYGEKVGSRLANLLEGPSRGKLAEKSVV